MPTIFTHVAVPLAVGVALGTRLISPRLLCAGILASIAPDLDVLGFRLGVAYSAIDGHRGLFHSLAFALFLALLAALAARPLQSTAARAFAFVGIAAASHGLLDMLTTGGMGVALFWPFSDTRHFFPWRLIRVSPLSLQRLLSPAGRAVMASELWVVWLPAALLCLTLWSARRWCHRAERLDDPAGRAPRPT
jgi:inner membrane protein